MVTASVFFEDQTAVQSVGGAAPAFTFGDSGSVSNKFLLNETAPSNLTGLHWGLYNGQIVKIFVSNQDVGTFTVTIYEHDNDNLNLVSLVSVTVTSSRIGSFGITDFGIVQPTVGKSIGVKVTSGTMKNPKVALIVIGDYDL